MRIISATNEDLLKRADLASIDDLLGALATNARPGLRADIDAFQQELWQGSILEDLGITVSDRKPIP